VGLSYCDPLQSGAPTTQTRVVTTESEGITYRRLSRVPVSSGEGDLPSPGLGGFDEPQLLSEHMALIAPEAQLRIQTIKMASAGVISLQGAGEPIKETGVLIDVWCS